MNHYKIGDVVNVETSGGGLKEYIGTGIVKETCDSACWVEMESGRVTKINIQQLRQVARGNSHNYPETPDY